MKAVVCSSLLLCVYLSLVVESGAQTPVGALAIDERRGDQYGWAVDYETVAAAQKRALQECGSGWSVVLTFGRCAAYAADQDADSTAVGWAESYASASGARAAALAKCRSRGAGAGCIVRAWGCNGPVVEEGLGLDRPARRRIQQGLQSAGFDPGGADGLFGPQTRAAIRNWQSSRGGRATGYLNGPQVRALRVGDGSPRSPVAVGTAAADAGAAEVVFWQSIQNSTNPTDFAAYLRRFPNGVFSELAQNRLSAMGAPAGERASPASVAATSVAAGGSAEPASRIRADETCTTKPAGTACWMEVSQRPGCYVWNPNLQAGETVTWTGVCTGDFADGSGTLTWIADGYRETSTGRLVAGEFDGHWVLRNASGTVHEGPFVDGERNGHWVERYETGTVAEGPFVDGERNGHWVIRLADDGVQEGPFVNGERHGHWVIRERDGSIRTEGPYVDGERQSLQWVRGDRPTTPTPASATAAGRATSVSPQRDVLVLWTKDPRVRTIDLYLNSNFVGTLRSAWERAFPVDCDWRERVDAEWAREGASVADRALGLNYFNELMEFTEYEGTDFNQDSVPAVIAPGSLAYRFVTHYRTGGESETSGEMKIVRGCNVFEIVP